MGAFERIIDCTADMTKAYGQFSSHYAQALNLSTKSYTETTGLYGSQLQTQAILFFVCTFSSSLLGAAGKMITADAAGLAQPNVNQNMLAQLGTCFGSVDPQTAKTFCKTAGKGLEQVQNIGNLIGNSITTQTDSKRQLTLQVEVSANQQAWADNNQGINKVTELANQIVQAHGREMG